MSLDFYLERTQPVCVFERNITHNLTEMANEAGIYEHLWHPDRIGITKAFELIEPLQTGLKLLKSDPKRFKQFDAPNGWGTYVHFVAFVEEVLAGCKEFQDADVKTSTYNHQHEKGMIWSFITALHLNTANILP